MRPSHRQLKPLVTAALLLFGCAGKAPAPSQAPAASEAPEPAAPIRQPAIGELDAEIRQWRVELGLSPQPPTTAAAGDVAEICGGLTECKDPCNLADKICENADKICEIAGDVGDPWAAQKCDDAKRSCDDARAICTCCEKQGGSLPAP